MLGLLHLLELAAPYGAIRGLQQRGRFLLRLGHGGGQVSPAHAEFDGDQAITLFARDDRRARPQELSRAGRVCRVHRPV